MNYLQYRWNKSWNVPELRNSAFDHFPLLCICFTCCLCSSKPFFLSSLLARLVDKWKIKSLLMVSASSSYSSGELKVSKSRNQILKFSFEPKNERKYFCISALAYKKRSNQKSSVGESKSSVFFLISDWSKSKFLKNLCNC